ncbi:glycosyltransferase family 39 protein [candidate division KSB1 bacterium]|nr:glycosyltransferase family 39 protein [candidate division KSB1 bacterium]
MIATLLRVLGAGWGMPYIFHPDERLMIARGVYFFSGDLNPHLFIYPSFLMYILFFVDAIVFIGGTLLGSFVSLSHFTGLYHTDPAVFYIPNRITIAIFGLLSLYAVYRLALHTFGTRTALLSFIFMAILPVHVLHSHFVTTDVPCLLFVVLSFYHSIRVLEHGALKNYLLAALWGGLAAGIKYNGGAVILCLILAHALREWESTTGTVIYRIVHLAKKMFKIKLLAPCLLSILVFIFTSPYTVLDLQAFIKDFMFQVTVQRRGHGLIFLGIGNKVLYEIFVVLRNWGGTLLWVSMLVGLVRSFFKIDKVKILYLFWIGFYFFALVTSNDFFIRYTLLLVPFMIILAADFLARGLASAKIAYKSVAILLTVGTIIYMGVYSTLITGSLVAQDPRITAKKWFESEVQHSTPVGLMTSSTGMQNRDDPPIDESRYSLFKSTSIAEVLEQQPEYIMLSRYDYIDFLRIGERSEYTRDSFYALTKLRSEQAEFKLVHVFDNSPTLFGIPLLGRYPMHDMMYTFPRIEIYKRQSDE